MLRRLRIQLTLLYLLAGVLLVAIMGGWMYFRMQNYFETNTDLALKYRLALELRNLAIPVSPEIEAAEKNFIEQSGSGKNPVLVTPTMGNDSEETPLTSPTAPSSPQTTLLPEDEPGDDNPASIVIPSSKILALSPYSTPTSVSTLAVRDRSHSEPDYDDLYYSQMAPIFTLNLDSSGNPVPGLNPQYSPMSPDLSAISAALRSGMDLRNGILTNGNPVRVLTYHLPVGSSPEYIQIGRPTDDHHRLLDQFLWNLLTISLVMLFALGLGSWWLAGRTLVPTQRSIERQQEFIANASHELRTPLTLIRASTELASRSIPAGDAKNLLGDVMKDVDYMSKLVEDLLLLSRLDHQRLKMQLQPVQVNSFLNETARQASLLVQAKNIQVRVEAAPGLIQVDPERLRQVMFILIDNAIQHTPAGGTISLQSLPSARQVEIHVADTGEGIPAEDLPHIFERFYKARGQSSKTRGAGLGLSIARGLVTAQKGSIRMDSQPGAGTRVILSFPVGK